jgi:hypothetical protein
MDHSNSQGSAAFSREFRLNAEAHVQVYVIGNECLPVVVVDNFLENPADLVEDASNSHFQPVTENLYPGIRSPVPTAYLNLVCEYLSTLTVFGLNHLKIGPHSRGDYSLITVRPEQLQMMQCLPHFDSKNPKQLAALHYLCSPEQGGTAFYCHRSTGFESMSGDRAQIYESTLKAELKKAGRLERNYFLGTSEFFEEIGVVGASFNRLVVYRSAMLHSGAIPREFNFSADPRVGRLTANVFVQFRRKSSL